MLPGNRGRNWSASERCFMATRMRVILIAATIVAAMLVLVIFNLLAPEFGI
jgi:hypothetical protein